MIYLDNAATTQLDPVVLESMMPFLTNEYGNAGGIYSLGRKAKSAVEDARCQVAALISAEPEQIIFTSGGTEANNMAVLSTMGRPYSLLRRKNHIIVSAAEHESVLRATEELKIKYRFDVDLLPVCPSGSTNVRLLESLLRDNTGLVSAMWVNNETGSENPVSELAEAAHKKHALFHADGVQAAGAVDVDVVRVGVDLLSLSAHKLHGPKGVGALYVNDPGIISPLIVGGRVQEFGLRGGTENVAGIVGFGKACEIAKASLRDDSIHTSVLKQHFYETLLAALSECSLQETVHVNGDSVVKPGRILNLRFDGVDAETLILMLDSRGICVSAGAACSGHETEPSHVLSAMGLSPELAMSSVRVSFSKYNTKAEAEASASVMAECVSALVQAPLL